MENSVKKYAVGVIVAAVLAAAAASGWANPTTNLGGPSQVASKIDNGHYKLTPLW
jgi:hypothetical protein